MQIGQSYIRRSPDGIISHITIDNHDYLEYYRDLEQHGFSYTPQYTIHRKLEECQSCSA